MRYVLVERLGIAYPIFENIPEENKVTEGSIGLQILPASSLEVQAKKTDEIDDVEELDDAKKRMRKRMAIYRVINIKNGVVWCSETDSGQRCFHQNTVLLLERGGTETQEE